MSSGGIKNSRSRILKDVVFNYIEYLIIGIVAFLVISYIIYRAKVLSYTYDESHTFCAFVIYPYEEIATSSVFVHANNHVLNSILTKFSYDLFGGSEIFLRLPNVIAGVIYLISSVSISRLLTQKYLRTVFFGFVLLNPFLLDYFSLSRGYGIALGGMMASIACFGYWLKSPTKLLEFGALICASLTVFSNYVMLNYFIPLVIILSIVKVVKVYKEYSNVLKNIFKYLRAVFLPCMILILTIVSSIAQLLKMRVDNGLYFGGDRNFWEDTFRSLITASLYDLELSMTLVKIIQYVILAIFIVSIVSFLNLLLIKKHQRNWVLPGVMVGLFVLAVASTVFQHVLLDTRYLIERTALFYIPLYVTSQLFVVDYIVSLSSMAFKRLFILFLSILLVLYSINFVININFTHTLTWSTDAHSKDVVFLVSQYHSTNPDCCSLSVSFWNEPPFLFYKISKNLDWLDFHSGCGNDDFIYNNECEVSDEKYEVVQEFNDIDTKLYKSREVILDSE